MSLMDATTLAWKQLCETITDSLNNPEIDRGLTKESENVVILDPTYGGEEGLE